MKFVLAVICIISILIGASLLFAAGDAAQVRKSFLKSAQAVTEL